jgi:Cu+-exporting ATPase
MGVSEANVNFATGKATVAYDPGAVELGQLIGTIEGAGYGAEVREMSVPVSGMTCASCVGRVERALRKVPGVLDVSVNLSTERAHVEYLSKVAEVRDLEVAIEGAGYGVVREEEASAEYAHESEYRELRTRFLVAAVLAGLILIGSLPMMLGFMSPMPMEWLNLGLLVLATPVQFWAGWRFYEGAWGGAKTQTGQHEYARRGRDERGLPVQRHGDARAAALRVRKGGRVLRYLRAHHYAYLVGQASRSAG